ncbi:uncharacterized protein B0H64DRAFT_369536 [Chaetomium fimeti]|uniref:Septum formation initiator domain-containing protein n=1 Tax=Chaetomium fimeti TaxID=1854472 RepID=A0AAE0HPC1_9PEZI|nr:hypothetical protein B0H64DRAFT_369536 [Chaetomium fimeti]
MSQNGGDASKASSPGRPRHQIKRSISEISSPIRLHRHHSYRAAKETERDSRTPAPQSAIPVVQGSRSFEWSRSEGVTPNQTPSASRRTSLLYASADEVMPATTKASKDNGVVNGLSKEQQKAAARESGLQRSLAELESFTTSTTKQLDDTYYGVLEKLGSLQGTVMALKELCERSRQLNSNFGTEADDLVTDINAQLDTFGQFEDQQQRIESLQGRIQSRRELIRSLGERVNAVSARIEGWERADREWQEKTRKRLKAVWVVTSVIFFLVLSLFIGSQYAPESPETTISRVASDGLSSLRHVTGTGAKTPQEKSWPSNNTDSLSVSSSTPDMLRAFDEL